jgi:polysaccharide deacetylase family protein (PEP-CTERM system associated)
VKNILTFDVEDWYHPHLIPEEIHRLSRSHHRVVEPTLRILRLLRRTGNQATFFVLGCIADSFPDMVRRIRDDGHEVASHGYGHRIVYNQNQKEFREDLLRSKRVLEAILGERVIGYRAPSWSVNEKTHWLMRELHRNRFLYDSSHYPFQTFLYGDNSNPRFFYNVPIDGGVVHEFPPSVVELFGRRIPFSGGFYFRFFPYRLIHLAIRRINRRVLDAWPERFIQYFNLHSTEAKLDRLLHDFQFMSIRRYMAEKDGVR